MRRSKTKLLIAMLFTLLTTACVTGNAASYPDCIYLPDFNTYPSDGISQLVFKTDKKTNRVTAVDRPDQPAKAYYTLRVDKASAARASLLLSVNGKQPDAYTIFRTIFYTSQGYPDTYVHKVKNSTPCSVTILKPANTEGNLAMNVIAFAA